MPDCTYSCRTKTARRQTRRLGLFKGRPLRMFQVLIPRSIFPIFPSPSLSDKRNAHRKRKRTEFGHLYHNSSSIVELLPIIILLLEGRGSLRLRFIYFLFVSQCHSIYKKITNKKQVPTEISMKVIEGTNLNRARYDGY